MSNIINVYLKKFVASMVAVAMTGLLAWSVIDSTTTGPSDQISVAIRPDRGQGRQPEACVPGCCLPPPNAHFRPVASGS